MSDNFFDSTVVSTRIRLARNIHGYPFPNRLNNRETAREIANIVYTGLKPLKDGCVIEYMDNIPPVTAQWYLENYLISKKLLENSRYSAVITNQDKTVSIMINEEDHIREQCFSTGLEVEKTYEMAVGVDDIVKESVVYAKSERLGYLTACPTNLGTGLRASVMLFLPALTVCNQMEGVMRDISPHRFILRGGDGEGSGAEGYLYQLSNEGTLGIGEFDTLMKLKAITSYLAKAESDCRKKIASSKDRRIIDSCARAYGVLTQAEILPYDEFFTLVSRLKFGVALDIYTGEMSMLNDFIVSMRPSNLVIDASKAKDKEINGTEQEKEEYARDCFRAECVRHAVKNCIFRQI